MKQTILLFVFALFFITNTTAQIKEGKYYENSDFLNFKSDSVNFKIEGNGGLIVDLYASGTYEVYKDFLIIKAGLYQSLKSTYKTIKKQNEKVKVTVYNKVHKPVKYVQIVLLDSLNNSLLSTFSDENGVAMIDNNVSADKISISLVGYDRYTIDYLNNIDYQVELMDYVVIENKIVVFKINSLNVDTLKLTLLSTDFKSKDSNMEKSLRKLEAKNKKYKDRERILIK